MKLYKEISKKQLLLWWKRNSEEHTKWRWRKSYQNIIQINKFQIKKIRSLVKLKKLLKWSDPLNNIKLNENYYNQLNKKIMFEIQKENSFKKLN